MKTISNQVKPKRLCLRDQIDYTKKLTGKARDCLEVLFWDQA